MAGTPRMRLDELVVDRGLADSRSLARSLIMAGLVSVDGVIRDKPGTSVPVTATLGLKKRPRFVSRAGEKLAHALETFGIDATGASAVDVGASTGGFVDCLLQRGASSVIAVDVGRGQLDARLRQDARVHVLDRLNARYLTPEQLPFVPDALTMDVSFISVEKVLPAVVSCMGESFWGLVLVKPQFEAGPERVGRGGIVRDQDVHREVLMSVASFVNTRLSLDILGVCDSGLPGADGNVEFFLRLSRGGEKGLGLDTLSTVVGETLRDLQNRSDGGQK